MRVALPSGLTINTDLVLYEREVPGHLDEPPKLTIAFACPMFRPSMIQVGAGAHLTFDSGPMTIELGGDDVTAYRNALLSRGGTTVGVATG